MPCVCLTARLPQVLTAKELEEIRNMFTILDVDKSGYVDISELTTACIVMGLPADDKSVREMSAPLPPPPQRPPP